ncbi:FAD-binding protein [Mesorhizobium sp. BHbdii]
MSRRRLAQPRDWRPTQIPGFSTKGGNPIAGFYACGNDMTSPMRGLYPGAGITIGPAIVFAYRAAMSVNQSPR